MDKRVLVVDDTAFMRRMLRDLLERIGITAIFEAVNGMDAVRQYKGVLPDLVLMDITMPEMDGLQALDEIVQFDPNACVVMVSSRSYAHLVVESHRSGATDFIAKPFQIDHVLETLCKHLRTAMAH